MVVTQLINRPYYSEAKAVEATGRAAKHLLQHLDECKGMFGIRTDKEAVISSLPESDTRPGHRLALKAPFKGFNDSSRDRIENYARAIAVWHNVDFIVDWKEKAVEIKFSLPEQIEWKERPRLRQRIKTFFRNLTLPKTVRSLNALGQMFTDNGFRVRDPFTAKLVMLDREYQGYAIQLRYPFDSASDKAGIKETYDQLVPLIADAAALEYKIKAEIQRSDDTTTIFVTKSRRYKPALYGTKPVFRLVATRPKFWTPKQFSLFQGTTFRACRKLFSEYKKDFITTKRPVAAIGKRGHTIPLHYRPGAGGRVVDDSYVLTVGKMTEQLSRRLGLQASVVHQDDAKVILVTFYTGRETEWTSGSRFLS